MKQSGVGREGGWEAARFFTEAKNVLPQTDVMYESHATQNHLGPLREPVSACPHARQVGNSAVRLRHRSSRTRQQDYSGRYNG